MLGLTGAAHTEYADDSHDEPAERPIITPLACSLRGGVDIEVVLTPGTVLAEWCGTDRVVERATCGYGLDPARQHVDDDGGLRIAAHEADSGEVRAVERADHPYFVATLYQPQLRSAPARAHPVFVGLVHSATR